MFGKKIARSKRQKAATEDSITAALLFIATSLQFVLSLHYISIIFIMSDDNSASSINPSQMEIPYAMNFSSDEQQAQDDSDSSSSCGGSFDSNSQRRNQPREPLRVNDVIEYTPAVFTAGTHLRRAVVLGIWPKERTFPLILDNAEPLPWDSTIQRIGEFYKGRVYRHAGKIKPLASFRLQQGGTKNVTIGLQAKAASFKKTILQVQQRAMSALRGEWKPPPPSTTTTSNTTKRRQRSDDSSSSSSSSSGILSIHEVEKDTKLPVKTNPCDEDSSTSSSSLPISISRTITVPARKKKGFSLTKTNIMKSSPRAKSRRRNISTKPTTSRGIIRRDVKVKTTTVAATSTTTAAAAASDNNNKKKYTGCSLGDSDECLDKLARLPLSTKKKQQTSWEEEPSSSNDDSKYTLSKLALKSLEQRRMERKYIPRGKTCLWSGSDDDDAELPLRKKSNKNSGTKKKRLDATKQMQSSCDDDDEDGLAYIVRQKLPKKKGASKGTKENSDTGKPQNTTAAPRAGTTKAAAPSFSKTATNTVPKKQSSSKRKKIDTTTMPEEDDEDEDITELLAKAKLRRIKSPTTSSEKKKSPACNMPLSSDDNDDDLLAPTFSIKYRNRKMGYDADEDSEDEDDLLTKPIWRQTQSTKRTPPSSKKRKKQQSPGSVPRSFPSRSPNNESRSRLVHDIQQHQRQERTSTPTSRSSLEDFSNKKRQGHVLSYSSGSDECSYNYGKKKIRKQKKPLSQWSTDCEVDSPPEAAESSVTRRGRNEFDFSSNDENDQKAEGSSSTKKRKILQKKHKKKRHKIQTSSRHH